MTYLAGQIFVCLLIAALIGGIIGWLLKSLASRSRIARLEEDFEAAESGRRAAIGERDSLSGDLDGARGKLREIETSLAATSGEKAALAENLEGARGQLADVEASLAVAAGEKASLAESLEGSAGRITELEAALVAMSEERDRVAEAQASAAADSQALAVLRGELSQAQGDLSRCREELASASATAAATAAAPPVAPVPLMSTPAAPPRRDDLKKVEGIGPKIEGLLNDAGIHNWVELGSAAVDRLQAILATAGERYRIHDPATWPQQAQLAADGRWEELESLQDRLSGGRED